VITSVHEPTLALTSFTTHPWKPFTLISSHFDSSILFWSLLSIPDIALAQYKMLLSVDSSDLFCPAEGVMAHENVRVKLCGTQSLDLSEKNKKRKPLEQGEKILRFF
jgi:hypothetical protein